MLEQTFDERETEPFATGGFSDIYKATIDGRPVAIKTLRVATTEYKKVHKVNRSDMKTFEQLITRESKLLAKEVTGWKWLQHDNILPFLGVVLEPPRFSIISERMENGNVMDFIKAHPHHNRLQLVSEWIGPAPHGTLIIWTASGCCNWLEIPTRSRHNSWGFEGSKPVSCSKFTLTLSIYRRTSW